MAYKITITYKGPEAESVTFVNPICRLFAPNNSYIDTPAYEGTVYDTNVDGWGKIDLMEPYATTSFPFPVPLAQFKLALVGDAVLDEDGNDTGAKTVTFTVPTYMEAFWYKQADKALEGQGFTVTVEEESATDSTSTSTPGESSGT